ncbi:MAG: hypothetical protein JW874_01015 [Spirochaetales bacterium]|nr:hypothetical protein [Spirochaetales bacterium]
MTEAAFFYYVICLSSGIASLIVLAVIAVRTPHPFLSRFLIFHFFYTVLICSFTVSVHLDAVGSAVSETAGPLLRFLIFTAKCGLVWGIAELVNSMFQVPGRRRIRLAVLSVLALVFILRILFSLIHLAGEPAVFSQTAPVSRIIIDATVICALGYLLVARVLRIHEVEPAECRSLARGISLLLACFAPFIITELIFFRRWGLAVFSPALYTAVSVLAVARLTALFLRTSSLPGQSGTDDAEIQYQRMSEFCSERGISRREEDVLGLMLQGLSNREIADRLCVSLSTVKTHVYSIFRKSGIKTRHKLFFLVQDKKTVPKF